MTLVKRRKFMLGRLRADLIVADRTRFSRLNCWQVPASKRVLRGLTASGKPHSVPACPEVRGALSSAYVETDRGGCCRSVCAAYKGPRLNAPSLVRFARPNPVS